MSNISQTRDLVKDTELQLVVSPAQRKEEASPCIYHVRRSIDSLVNYLSTVLHLKAAVFVLLKEPEN